MEVDGRKPPHDPLARSPDKGLSVAALSSRLGSSRGADKVAGLEFQVPVAVADLLGHRLADEVREPNRSRRRLRRRLRHDRHRALRPRHRDVVDAERLLLDAILARCPRVRQSLEDLCHPRARIGQHPAVRLERTVRLRRERVVFVERQHDIVEAEALRAVDRHDLDLARLGDVPLLLRFEIAREVREPHARLHRKLELRGRAQKVREALLREDAPRLRRILGKERAQLAEDADEAARREGARGPGRDLGGGRHALGILGAGERGRAEVTVGLRVPRMVGERDEVEVAAQRGRVVDGALAFPHDAGKARRLQLRREELAHRVRPHQHRGRETSGDRIHGLQRVEDRRDEVRRLRAGRLHALHVAAQLGTRRLVDRRGPRREVVLHPSVHKHGIHRVHDRGARPVRLDQFARRIRAALPLAREDADVAVAPAVDRLLAVADDEDALVAVRLLRLLDQRTHRLPLLAARVLELVERPRANLRVHAVLEAEALLVGKSRNEPRHVGEDEPSRRAHLLRILRLVDGDEREDAARELQLEAKHVAADGPHRRADRRRLFAAVAERLAVERDVDRRAREEIVLLEELLRKSLHALEAAAEAFDPRGEVTERLVRPGREPHARGRRLHVRLRCGRLRGRIAPDRLRDPPGVGGRMREHVLVPRGDEGAVRLREAADVLTVHRQREGLDERLLRGAVRPAQDRERGARELHARTVLVHHLQVAAESELEREAADDPHQEAVKRSDLRKVLRRDHLAEKRDAGRILRGTVRQERDEALEDLARRRARKGERDDFLRLHAEAQEFDEPLGEGLRLAGSGGRFDQQVRVHLRPPPSSPLPRPPGPQDDAAGPRATRRSHSPRAY